MDQLAQKLQFTQRDLEDASASADGRIDQLELLKYYTSHVSAGESTTSDSWGNLTTAGPEVLLPSGTYAVFFGATIGLEMQDGTANSAHAGIAINGVNPDNADIVTYRLTDWTSAVGPISSEASVSKMSIKVFATNPTLVTMKYDAHGAGNTTNFWNRWISAIRIG